MSEHLVFWSNHAKELQGSTGQKIKAILAQRAIEYVAADRVAGTHGKFLIHPLKNKDGTPYNKTTYTVESIKGIFTCDCQGYCSKEERYKADPIENGPPVCSHVAAVHEFLKRIHLERQGILDPTPASMAVKA